MKLMDTCTLAEVAAVLDQHGRLRCVPQVEQDGTIVRLTVEVPAQGLEIGHHGLMRVSLLHALEYLEGLAQVRAFAIAHGIDEAALERLLPDRKGDDDDDEQTGRRAEGHQ